MYMWYLVHTTINITFCLCQRVSVMEIRVKMAAHAAFHQAELLLAHAHQATVAPPVSVRFSCAVSPVSNCHLFSPTICHFIFLKTFFVHEHSTLVFVCRRICVLIHSASVCGDSYCENGGTCDVTAAGNALCDCAEGYSGTSRTSFTQ